MKRSTFPIVAILVALLSVSGCAKLRGMDEPRQADKANPWPVYIAGEKLDDRFVGRPFEELLRDPKIGEALRQLTDELAEGGFNIETREGRRAIRNQLDFLAGDLDEPVRVAEQLRGFEGVSTALLLRIVLFGEIVELEGNIRDYVYVKESDKTATTKETGSGHLAVDMTTKFFRSIADRDADEPFKTQFLHWDVEVLEGGFQVHERQGSPANPDNPFPDLPDFVMPEDAVNPNHPMSIWMRGLNLKVHARGEKRIRIRNIFQQIDDDPQQIDDDPIERLPSSGPNRDPRYMVTENSCVDLIVKGYPPTQVSTIPPKNATELFAAGGDFCLGRCEHPSIVNTGGGR